MGAFEKALSNLNLEYETVGTSEWDINAIISYDAIHTNDGIDYSKNMSKADILKELESYTFTTDGKKHCDKSKIKLNTLRKLYNANLRIKNLGSITDVDETKLPEFDLMSWGFPCVDISIAGKQKGFTDDDGNQTRSGLYYEGLRILKHNKPKYSIVENVEALTHKKFKNEFTQVLSDLEDAGYNNYYQVLNSKNFGIAQNRSRIFIVSIRKDIDNKQYQFPSPFDNGLRLKDFLESNVDEKYYISKDKTEKLLSQLKDKQMNKQSLNKIGNVNPSGNGMNGNVFSDEGLAPTITTNKGEGNKILTYDNQITIPCLTPDRVEKRQNDRRFKEDGDPMFTLTSQDKHGVLLNENISDNQCECIGRLDNINGHDYLKRVYSTEGCSPTVTTVTGGNQEIKILETQDHLLEIWKPIPNFEGYYEISSYGNLRSLDRFTPSCYDSERFIKGKLIVKTIDKYGYYKVQLNKDGEVKHTTIHRLVASNFINNPLNLPIVNHIDGNKLNNNVSNLEWGTPLWNNIHRRDVLKKHGGKDNVPRGVKWNKEKGKWDSFIKKDSKSKFLGYFLKKEDAYCAYYEAFISLFNYEPWNVYEFEEESKSIVDKFFKNQPNREPHILEQTNEIKQIGTIDGTNFNQNKVVYDIEYIAPTIQGQGHSGNEPKILEDFYTNRDVRDYEETCPTLRADRQGLKVVEDDKKPNYRIRKLVPKETLKLMGFSNLDYEKIKSADMSDSAIYKQSGNSIVVTVLMGIFGELFNVEYKDKIMDIRKFYSSLNSLFIN